MDKFKRALEHAVRHDDAGSWYYVVKALKTRYKQSVIGHGDEFDAEVLSHFNALLEIFEDAAMPI